MELYNMFLVLNLENILIIPSNFSFLDFLLAGDKKITVYHHYQLDKVKVYVIKMVSCLF